MRQALLTRLDHFFPCHFNSRKKPFKPFVFFFVVVVVVFLSAAENSRAEADLFSVLYSENKAQIFT